MSVSIVPRVNGVDTNVSDRIGIMLEGELVEVNDAQTIYRAPQHAYTKRLWASMPKLHGQQIGAEVQE